MHLNALQKMHCEKNDLLQLHKKHMKNCQCTFAEQHFLGVWLSYDFDIFLEGKTR